MNKNCVKTKNAVEELEKVLNSFGNHPLSYKVENTEGKLSEVSKNEFVNWVEEGKNIKIPPKESLVYGVSGDIDGLTYFTERKGKDGVFKESYYEPRSEEDKNRIIEKGRKRREQENSQFENSSPQQEKWEKETNQQDFPQKTDKQEEIKEKNKESNNQNIYYGVGLVSLVLLLTSMVVVRMKKKK